ncbi:MAG: hypothetical protein COB78_05350 [Hyphomicrobiales bacterium]|nr:MAG: hypothetical protein COB78_05350 [Hyphomicrobiales bacterium]
MAVDNCGVPLIESCRTESVNNEVLPMPLFELPQTFEEWLPFMVPLVTLLIGLGYLLMPKMVLGRLGLEGGLNHPEGIGAGRSNFGGFMVGLSIVCILFQQPVLNQALTLSWGIAALGKLVHLVLDGGLRQKPAINLARLAVAAALAGYSYTQTGIPDGLKEFQFIIPESQTVFLPWVAAAITFLMGAVSFLVPSGMLVFMRMKTKVGSESAKGEPRGVLAGFYLGVSALLLMSPDVSAVPGLFMGFALGICWIMSAFGRMISMLSDRGNTLFNWFALILDLLLAALPFVVVLGLVK